MSPSRLFDSAKAKKKPVITIQNGQEVGTCPITLERMVDPVIDPDGNTYERSAIENWIRAHGTSPLTRRPLQRDSLQPNRALAALLQRMSLKDTEAIVERQKEESQVTRRDSNTMQIFVRDLTNKTLVLDCQPTTTIEEIKRMIVGPTSVPTHEQLLLWCGKQLRDDDKTVRDYNISDGATLHLVVRLRGGD